MRLLMVVRQPSTHEPIGQREEPARIRSLASTGVALGSKGALALIGIAVPGGKINAELGRRKSALAARRSFADLMMRPRPKVEARHGHWPTFASSKQPDAKRNRPPITDSNPHTC